MKVFITMLIAMSLLAQAVLSCDPPAPPPNFELQACVWSCIPNTIPNEKEKEEQKQCEDECHEELA